MAESLRILILEDNPTDAELVQFELREAGITFNSIVVKTEKDFVRELQDYSPDLILSDYDLPQYNGALALGEAKRRCPEIPFILVTGAVGEDRAIEILTQGAKDYVLKTRLQLRLVPAVRRALAEAAEHHARKQAEAELREAHRTLEERVKIRTAELEAEISERMKMEEMLRVHQIELEMQSEELQRAHSELNASQERYFDLYDLAPLGYVTLSEKGLILEANLTAATLLGRARSDLVKQPLTRSIFPEDQDIYYRHRRQLFESGEPQACELRLVKKDGTAFWAHLEATAAQDGDGAPVCRVVMGEITERKRVEEELQFLSSRNEAILASIPDIIMEVDNNKIYTWANRTGKEFFGDGVIGKEAVFYFEGEQETYDIVSPLFSGSEDVIYVESWQRRQDGEKRLLAWWCRVLKDAEGNVTGALSTARDITDHKKAEQALRENEQRYHDLFDQANEGLLMMTPDGQLSEVNQSFAEIHGYTVDELKHKDIRELDVLKERTLEDRADIVRRIQAGEVVRFEVNHYHKDRHVFPLSVTASMISLGGQIYYMAFHQDITEPKRAEEELRESEERYRMLFEGSTHGILMTDIGTGRFVDANVSICRMLGYSKAELLQFGIADIHPKGSLDHVMSAFESQIRGGRPMSYAIPCLRKDGTVFYADIVGASTIFHGRRCVVGFLMDITERKRVEDMIQVSLLEKETMLKEIHHRVKNNLQVISSLLNMQSSYLQDEKAREALWESMARVRTMAMIHTQLYQSQDLARIDFGLFIRDLIGNVSQSYGRAEFPVKINVNADEIHLGIDASIPCGLILNELVSNALKHAFPEGKTGEINIRMRSEDSHVMLTVQDNGIGFTKLIDSSNLKSMGLELVNILVRQMNGKIDRQVDGGTVWIITFPIKNERVWQNG